MKLISCSMTENHTLSGECCLRRDMLSTKSHGGYDLKSTSSLTAPSQLSRSYVQQVSSVAWPKARSGRPRSNSYPFIRRWSPLPRVIEEDESLQESPVTGTIPYVSKVAVQKINLEDNQLSQEWLCKINSLSSTLALADSSWPKVKRCRPRSNSFPFIKRLNPLPCVNEEEETAEDEKPKMANPKTSQLQTLKWTDDKLSHDLLDKINMLRATLPVTDHSPTPRVARLEAKPLVASNASGKTLNLPAARGKNSGGRGSETEDEVSCNRSIRKEISHKRKPDSTYISLISGFTLEPMGRVHVQSRAIDHQTPNALTRDLELKRDKSCKKVKCIAFSPRKLFCSSPRQDVPTRKSNSSEYIPQMGCEDR